MAANDPIGKYASFAKRMLAGMKRTGVTPKAIREEWKVDAETVRLWARGQRMPRDKALRTLAKMIDVDVSILRYGEDTKHAPLPQFRGVHVTDEDEIRLLEAYRGLRKEWAREALRRRAVELLEEFGEAGVKNPWARSGTQ